ncbi:MAG: pentapeptide repeat-containing protein, partial [Ruminiclostridium sp.]
MEIGDFVKGKPEASERYSITTEKMTKGVVTQIMGDTEIKVKILEHTSGSSGSYDVESKYFEVIGYQKKFNREEVLELLKNGCKKAILDYDLTDANLTGANLTDANLTGADLTDANLTRADLTLANLTDA